MFSSFFEPSQFGVACKAGAEMIMHNMRRCTEYNCLNGNILVFKMNMSNAFDMVSRQAVFGCVCYFLPLAIYTIVLFCPSNSCTNNNIFK